MSENSRSGPIQVTGEVLSIRRAGDYFVLTLTAPGIPELARPGHFVALGVGGVTSANLLRRAFSIYTVQSRGVYGGTLEVVFAVHGAGTEWMSGLHRGQQVDIVGPLGKPFMLPKNPVPCVLVAGGYGSAPMFTLADALRARGCRVDVVFGAATESKLFGVLEAKRVAASITITTDDGSVGEQGRVTDVLPAVIKRTDAAVVYACGPMAMLREVARISAEQGAYSQCAVEESMACGIGVCMTCVLPVIGQDGVTRMVRSCVEGPIFRGDRVRWDDVDTIPDDVYGAPVKGGH